MSRVMATEDLYPKALGSDDEVEMDESESDNEDVEAVRVKKKKKVAGASSEFSSDFYFEGFAQLRQDRDTEYLKRFMKKGDSSTLDDKIAAMRKNAGIAGEGGDADEESDEEEDVEQLGDVQVVDRVREKQKKGRKRALPEDTFFEEMEESQNSGPEITFEQMNLSRPILRAVGAANFVDPTPIQAACIPVALAGKDICACAATGTGKTGAFVIPILERLLYRPAGQRSVTRVLVLVPTRELAIQVFQVFRKLSSYSQLEVCLCAGGLDLKAQEAALRTGPDVVVATPGRLIDHVHNAPSFTLNNVEVLVLDEADRMLEEAFQDQMNELIRLCAPNRQTLLFSATMTDQIDELASVSLKRPVKIFINENTDTALGLRQEFIRIRAGRETDREAVVAAIVTRTFQENTIIFVKTKKDCQRMHILLGLLGIKAGQMSSSLSQAQRIEALSKFKNKQLDVLVSTDLASRGLDIEGVLTVINMHMPQTMKQYIHRVGRTARAGKAGRSISLVGENERKLLKEIVGANPDRKLKQRNVAAEVIEAYRRRIDSLEDSLSQIEEEERQDREIRIAEAQLKKTEDKLETGTTERDGRVWYKKASVAEKARKRADKKAQKQVEKKKQDSAMTPEEKSVQYEAAFLAREAKRSRRGKRIRAVVEHVPKASIATKKKTHSMASASFASIVSDKTGRSGKSAPRPAGSVKKQSFTSSLTAVGSRAVKAARRGPEDKQFIKARVAHRLKTKKN